MGIVRFDGCFQYETKVAWAADRERHQVPPDDPDFGWNPKKEKWGWEVGYCKKLEKPLPAPYPRGIVFCKDCQIVP